MGIEAEIILIQQEKCKKVTCKEVRESLGAEKKVHSALGYEFVFSKASYKFVSSHCPNECVVVEECGDGEKECGFVGFEVAVKKVVIF